MKMVAGVQRYWIMRGHYEVVLRNMERVLALDVDREPSDERVSALLRSGGFLLSAGDHVRARERLEEAAHIEGVLHGNRSAAVLGGLGVVAMMDNRMEDALALTN